MHAIELIEIRESGIHNKGAYALVDMPKWTRIIEYKGEKIPKKEGDRRGDLLKEEHDKVPSCAATYVFELNDQYDLDGDIPGNDAKYINHSCEPNCDFEVEDERIWIYAKRDIKAGEELTYNYGFELDNDLHPCRCGSKKCIGYMLSEEDWPKLAQKTQPVLPGPDKS